MRCVFPIDLYEWIALIITRDDHLRLYGSHTEGPSCYCSNSCYAVMSWLTRCLESFTSFAVSVMVSPPSTSW